TSANLSGQKSPMKFSDISEEIRKAVDYVVEDPDNKVSEFSGSSVIKVWNNNQIKILRE
ncbi:MAG: translation factor Sua5, partial [Pseudopedobacter saltans]